MRVIKVEMILQAGLCLFNKEQYEYNIYPILLEGNIEVSRESISMIVPEDFDPNIGHIEVLKEEKQKIGAEAQIKMNNIEEQIQSLLAIECDK